MEDKAIIDLYVKRSENAISETEKKYSSFCLSIAYNILRDNGESEECTNDTYLKLWNSIPPQIPAILKNYIAKIARNTALQFYRMKHRLKRGGDTVEIALSEIAECVDMTNDVESETEKKETSEKISEMLFHLIKTDVPKLDGNNRLSSLSSEINIKSFPSPIAVMSEGSLKIIDVLTELFIFCPKYDLIFVFSAFSKGQLYV